MNYIFRNNNQLIQLFYEDNNIWKKEHNNDLEKEKIILENRKSNFTASKYKDKIYIFSQNLKGDILLSIMDEIHIQEQTILKNQSGSSKAYKVFFYPLITSSSITLIYNAFFDNNHVLLIQKMGEQGKWEKAIKLDIIKLFKNQILFYEKLDEAHGLFFYQKKDKNAYKLGFREININNYSEFKPIYTTSNQIIDITTLSTNKGICTAFIIKGLFSYQLIFIKKEKDFNNPIVISENQVLDKPLLFLADKLYLFFISGTNIFYCYSTNYGDSFSSPEKYKKDKGSEIHKAFYCCPDNTTYLGKEIYVNKDGQVKIITDYCDFIIYEKENNRLKEELNSNEEFDILEEKISILQNKLMEKEKNMNFKDQQILSLTKSLQAKNNEINLLIGDINQYRKDNITVKLNENSENPIMD